MLSLPRVSVVMASYNHARFVGDVIDSVLSQNFTDFEFIIVDDGSSDNSVDVIRSKHDPRIIFEVFAKNQGASQATNRALELARGEYVTLIDSDVNFLPGKLSKQVTFLDAHPHVVVTFGHPVFINEKGQRLAPKSVPFGTLFEVASLDRVGQNRRLFDRGNFFCHPTMMARRALFDRCGAYDTLLRQLGDYDLWCRAIGLGDLHIANEELIEFRVLRNGGNVSTPNNASLRRTLWETVRVLGRFSDLPPDLLEAAFGDRVAEAHKHPDCPWPIKLAYIAAELTSPAHQVFAIETIEKACRDDVPYVTPPLLHDLRGRLDPFRLTSKSSARTWRRNIKMRLKRLFGFG